MKVIVLLFSNFETLDVFGPVEILGRLSSIFEIDYFSLNGGVISSTQGVKISTKEIANIKSTEIDILLIPGGIGTRVEINNERLINKIKLLSESSRYVLSVCTGSALLAKTKLLDNRVATSNKRAIEWVVSIRPEVKWKKKARWTIDEKYYTSSGISAGMDMTLGFIHDVISPEVASNIAFEMEYNWNNDPENDEFCIE